LKWKLKLKEFDWRKNSKKLRKRESVLNKKLKQRGSVKKKRPRLRE
jgi:hypothetical protein